MDETKKVLNDEYKDLVAYFRLSMIRDRGILDEHGLKQLQEIVARNPRAAEIESARSLYLRGEVNEDFYKHVYFAHRRDLAEAIKNGTAGKEEPVKTEEHELSKEFTDLARYFRLSIARNRGELTPEERDELDELIKNNERASVLEDARKRLLAGELNPDDYEKIVATHRGALAQAIKDLYYEKEKAKDTPSVKEPVPEKEEEKKVPTLEVTEEPKKERTPVPVLEVKEDNKKVEPVKAPKEKPKEPKTVNKKPKESALNKLREEKNKIAAKEKITDIVNKKEEEKPTIEPVVEQPKEINNKPSKMDEYYRREFKDAFGSVKPTVQQVAPRMIPLPDEYRQLARYFRLSMIRDKGEMIPEGEKELLIIANTNERAHAIEETRNQYIMGNISEKSYREFYATQRAALADAIKKAGPSMPMQMDKTVNNNNPGPQVPPSAAPANETVHIKEVMELQKGALARRAIRAYNEYQTITSALGYNDISDLLEHFNFNTGKFTEKKQETNGKTI